MYRGAEVFPRKIAMKIGQLSLDGTAIGHWWYVQGVTITFSSGWTVVCVHVVVAASIHGDGAGDNNSSSCLLRGDDCAQNLTKLKSSETSKRSEEKLSSKTCEDHLCVPSNLPHYSSVSRLCCVVRHHLSFIRGT